MMVHTIKLLCAAFCYAMAMNRVERGDMLVAVFHFGAMVGWLVSAWGDRR